MKNPFKQIENTLLGLEFDRWNQLKTKLVAMPPGDKAHEIAYILEKTHSYLIFAQNKLDEGQQIGRVLDHVRKLLTDAELIDLS